ncbi:MAG: hypothetical protein ABI051_04340 [Vicinamibacterales bacterium]
MIECDVASLSGQVTVPTNFLSLMTPASRTWPYFSELWTPSQVDLVIADDEWVEVRLRPTDDDARVFLETCGRMGVPAVLERSRSGRGGSARTC